MDGSRHVNNFICPDCATGLYCRPHKTKQTKAGAMRKSLWPILLILSLLSACASNNSTNATASNNSTNATRNTYNLVGVTLANGATVTGQFDWDDAPGSFAYTNVNIVVGGSGAEAGFNITTPDPMNTDGLCVSDPPTSADFCGSTDRPSLLFIFDNRLTPNGLNTTAAVLSSDTICLGICFKGQDSQVNYPDGLSVAITGGSVVGHHRLKRSV